MSQITTHVLDIAAGRPADGVPLLLELQVSGTEWKQVGRGTTDKDGRCRDLLPPAGLIEGTYRITFDTQTYFASNKVKTLYPQVIVVLSVRDAGQHYHIPLLLSPFGYSTYRGT
jgi:5-hydroxyisourate hydrolase